MLVRWEIVLFDRSAFLFMKCVPLFVRSPSILFKCFWVLVFQGEGCWEGRMRLGKGGWRWMPFKGALVCECVGPSRRPTMGQTMDFNQGVGSCFVPVHESKEWTRGFGHEQGKGNCLGRYPRQPACVETLREAPSETDKEDSSSLRNEDGAKGLLNMRRRVRLKGGKMKALQIYSVLDVVVRHGMCPVVWVKTVKHYSCMCVHKHTCNFPTKTEKKNWLPKSKC